MIKFHHIYPISVYEVILYTIYEILSALTTNLRTPNSLRKVVGPLKNKKIFKVHVEPKRK
jgi:hypothetical protein